MNCDHYTQPIHAPGWMLTYAVRYIDHDTPGLFTEPVAYFVNGSPHISIEDAFISDADGEGAAQMLWHPDQHRDGEPMTRARAEALVLHELRAKGDQ